jgi:hypothetical protein
MVTPALCSCWLIVDQWTLSLAAIWRRVQPWPYKSAARLTSTASPSGVLVRHLARRVAEESR